MAESPRTLHFRISSLITGAFALASVLSLALTDIGRAQDRPSPGHDLFGRSGSKVKTRFDSAFQRYNSANQDGFSGTIHDKWALLIGVSRYQDKMIAPMKVARNNVMLMSETLSNGGVGHFPPGHISYLLGANATHSMIHAAFFGSALAHRALPSDLILIYICGRTMQIDKDGDICLCTYDTIASEPQSSAINLKELLSSLRKRTQCPQIVCLIDCEPNSVNSPHKGDPISLSELAKATGVTILSANSLSNSSHPCGVGTFSCFCQFLTEALKSSSGMMPIGNLAGFIQDNVNTEHPSDEAKQEVTFVGAPGNDRAADLQLGAPIHAPWSITKANIGHNVDTLALDRPDLIETGQHKSKLFLKSHSSQNLIAHAPQTDKVAFDVTAPTAKTGNNVISNGASPGDAGEAPADIDLNPYVARAKAAIRAKWQPPKGLENRQVVTTLTIQKDGTISNTAVIGGSGDAGIDQGALRALKAASPLEPLPKGAPASIELRYIFDWNVSSK
jgi:TonB family protein